MVSLIYDDVAECPQGIPAEWVEQSLDGSDYDLLHAAGGAFVGLLDGGFKAGGPEQLVLRLADELIPVGQDEDTAVVGYGVGRHGGEDHGLAGAGWQHDEHAVILCPVGMDGSACLLLEWAEDHLGSFSLHPSCLAPKYLAHLSNAFIGIGSGRRSLSLHRWQNDSMVLQSMKVQGGIMTPS